MPRKINNLAEFIQFHAGWFVFQGRAGQGGFGTRPYGNGNLPEQTLSLERAQGHKIRPGIAVIVILQPNGASMVDFRVVQHEFRSKKPPLPVWYSPANQGSS